MKNGECYLIYEDQDPNHHNFRCPYLYFLIIIINIKELMSEKPNPKKGEPWKPKEKFDKKANKEKLK